MNILYTISSIDSQASGPAYSVPRLGLALGNFANEVRFVTLGTTKGETERNQQIVRCRPDFSSLPIVRKLGHSREMRQRLLSCDADIVHTHGLWMMPNVYPAEAARRLGRPFVLSPRGMLGRDALKFSAAAKRLFWAVWQKHAVGAVTCFHATAESEYDDIRGFGLRQPVAIIPNGIDLPDLSDLTSSNNRTTEPIDRAPFILSLGRVHPKKGLDRLVAAFASIANVYPEWMLRIVGPDERGYAGELKRQVATANLSERVSIEPPIFGNEKFLLMQQAEIFALSTLHENFGMTVAESLAVETPVIATRGAPWADLEVHGCGLWVEHGPAAMAKALEELISMPREQRQKMGARGRAWMQRDFEWDGIAAKMFDVYSWQLGRQERPSWVWS